MSIPAIIKDALTMAGVPTHLLEELHRRRVLESQRELISALQRGDVDLDQALEQDGGLDLIYSFMLAAVTGTTKRNLSILASLLVSSLKGPDLNVDEFQRLKQIISILSYDELKVVAAIRKTASSFSNNDTEDRVGISRKNLQDVTGMKISRIDTILFSLLGKGLVRADVLASGITFYYSPDLRRISELAGVEVSPQ